MAQNISTIDDRAFEYMEAQIRSLLGGRISNSPGLRSISSYLVTMLPDDGQGNIVLGTSVFLEGVILAGLDQKSADGFTNSSHWFARWLRENASKEISLFLHDYEASKSSRLTRLQYQYDLHSSITLSRALNYRLDLAVKFSGETIGSSIADLRHVLAAILTGPDKGRYRYTVKSPFLAPHLINSFLPALFDHISTESEKGEDIEAWMRILLEGRTAGPGEGRLGDRADASNLSPTFKRQNFFTRVWNDTADLASPDLLNIGHEVTAFARLIASKTTVPPLSIGIFGEWGAGKSYFMESVLSAVKALADSKDSEDRKIFHEGIVQIRFNAWHYIETNLWASLVEHIFRELDLWLRKESKDSNRLFNQLVTSRQLRFEAARDLIEHLAKVEAAEVGVARARERQEKVLKEGTEMSAATLWNAAVKSFEDNLETEDYEKLEGVKAELGLENIYARVDAVGQLVEEAGEQSKRANVLFRAMLNRLSSGRIAIYLALVILIVPFLVQAGRDFLAWLLGSPTWLGVSSSILGLGSLLSTTVAVGGYFLKRGKQTLDVLDSFRAKLDDAITNATKAQRAAVIDSEQKLEAAKADVAQAERHFDEISAQVKQAEQDFQDEGVRGRLNRFIRDKISDGVYSKHLSLIAVVRKDFGQLTEIMVDTPGDWEAEELRTSREQYAAKVDELLKENEKVVTKEIRAALKEEVPPLELRYFNRIVLYIDDLDRCPPERVSQVIQAIHLLLFFRLFVVVVAVDAKWMARSLESEFPRLLTNGDKEASDDLPPATAQDYIEKIFQIPFWVQRMTGEASREFVRALASSRAETTASLAPPLEGSVTTGGAIDTRDVTPNINGVIEPVKAMPGEQSSSASPEVQSSNTTKRLPFSEVNFSQLEIRVLASFAPLTSTSPRRAKRILNVYQVLKTALHLAAADGEIAWSDLYCPAILTMLAVLDGPRGEENEFFTNLLKERDKPASLAHLQREMARGERNKLVLATLANVLKQESLSRGPDIVALMRTLAPTVRRYSFDCRL